MFGDSCVLFAVSESEKMTMPRHVREDRIGYDKQMQCGIFSDPLFVSGECGAGDSGVP